MLPRGSGVAVLADAMDEHSLCPPVGVNFLFLGADLCSACKEFLIGGVADKNG